MDVNGLPELDRVGRLALGVHRGLRRVAPALLAGGLVGAVLLFGAGSWGWSPRCQQGVNLSGSPCLAALENWGIMMNAGAGAAATCLAVALGHYVGQAVGRRPDRKVRKAHAAFVAEARGWVAAGRLPAKSLQEFQEAIERVWHGDTAARTLGGAASSLVIVGLLAALPAASAGVYLVERSLYGNRDPWLAPVGYLLIAAAGFGGLCFVLGLALALQAGRQQRRERAALERHATELAGEAAEVPAPAKPNKKPVLVAPGARRPD